MKTFTRLVVATMFVGFSAAGVARAESGAEKKEKRKIYVKHDAWSFGKTRTLSGQLKKTYDWIFLANTGQHLIERISVIHGHMSDFRAKWREGRFDIHRDRIIVGYISWKHGLRAKPYIAMDYSRRSLGYYVFPFVERGGRHRAPVGYAAAAARMLTSKRPIRFDRGTCSWAWRQNVSVGHAKSMIGGYVNQVERAIRSNQIRGKRRLNDVHDAVHNCLSALMRKRGGAKVGQHLKWSKGQSFPTVANAILGDITRIRSELRK